MLNFYILIGRPYFTIILVCKLQRNAKFLTIYKPTIVFKKRVWETKAILGDCLESVGSNNYHIMYCNDSFVPCPHHLKTNIKTRRISSNQLRKCWLCFTIIKHPSFVVVVVVLIWYLEWNYFGVYIQDYKKDFLSLLCQKNRVHIHFSTKNKKITFYVAEFFIWKHAA